MNTLSNAIKNQKTTTTNGMKARKQTGSACVDLFFKIGAMRMQDPIPLFTSALVENEEKAIRILLHARDIQKGMGERQIFRDILLFLENTNSNLLTKILYKIPELGRWDDLLIFKTEDIKIKSYSLIKNSLLIEKNSLCAKWMPREKSSKKAIAKELMNFLNTNSRSYRKLLSSLTKVVESKMCKNDWDNINFSHVPSVASNIYRKAFNRHTSKYKEYVEKLVKNDSSVKINANAIFPHDIIKGKMRNFGIDGTGLNSMIAQWNALPSYMNDANALAIVDTSLSMFTKVSRNSDLMAIEVAVSLGLYCADKNTGNFKDLFFTFSDNSELNVLEGNIAQKIDQMMKSNWGGSTNIEAALKKLLSIATEGKVNNSEMPKMLIILSDMQFNYCTKFDVSAFKMIKKMYKESGYEIPNIVFWNLNSYENVPVKFDKSGVALVSGFSTNILKSILKVEMDSFTPEGIMNNTIMSSRYDY